MKSFKQHLTESFSKEVAKELGNKLSVNWNKVDIDEFIKGLSVEKEHDDGGKLDVVSSNLDLAKIVLAHLKERPDYYTKLKSVEEDVPANSISAGGIAGLKEPIIRKRPKLSVR
jgi:hypothetical protein